MILIDSQNYSFSFFLILFLFLHMCSCIYIYLCKSETSVCGGNHLTIDGKSYCWAQLRFVCEFLVCPSVSSFSKSHFKQRFSKKQACRSLQITIVLPCLYFMYYVLPVLSVSCYVYVLLSIIIKLYLLKYMILFLLCICKFVDLFPSIPPSAALFSSSSSSSSFFLFFCKREPYSTLYI